MVAPVYIVVESIKYYIMRNKDIKVVAMHEEIVQMSMFLLPIVIVYQLICHNKIGGLFESNHHSCS